MIPCLPRPAPRGALCDIDAERICLIKPSALGDIVQSLPVLRALRWRFPRAHIAWVVHAAYADLLAGHPDLDERIVLDRHGKAAAGNTSRRVWLELLGRLRAGRFDLACDLQGLLRSGVMAAATGARRRIGLASAREGSRFFYTDLVPVPDDEMSAVDRYWLLAKALGVAGAKEFRLAIDAESRRWAERQTPALAGLQVAIHPGAMWETKRWPAEHFAEIARRLAGQRGARLVLVGAASDAAAAAAIEAALPGHCVNLAGRTTLKQLAAVLERVDLLMSNDSGPMHLAAALGTPVAAIFTCTSPRRAGPYGPGHLVFPSRLWCAASYLKRCARLECMRELTPDRVWPALCQHIDRLPTRRARPA